MKKEITIQTAWLIKLNKLSQEVKKDIDKWNDGTKPLMPTSIYRLTGFSSSAEILLKYKL